MINDQTILKVLLEASLIPHGSKVSKLTGEVEYIICHSLKLYQSNKQTPITIVEIFLTYNGFNINQINPETKLHWITTIGELKEIIDLQERVNS